MNDHDRPDSTGSEPTREGARQATDLRGGSAGGGRGRQGSRRRHRGVEGRGVAGNKRTARDLGAYICFEDEAGQGLGRPKGRTWARRGTRAVVKVRGAGGGRVSIAGVVCYRPGDRPRLFYQLRTHRRRKGEPKGFTWADYRDLMEVNVLGPCYCGTHAMRHMLSEGHGVIVNLTSGDPGCHDRPHRGGNRMHGPVGRCRIQVRHGHGEHHLACPVG